LSIFSIPPNYFYAGIILIFILHICFPAQATINAPFSLIGILLIFLGSYLIIKPFLVFKKNKTPMKIVQEAPYSWSRNPMYLGATVFLVGCAVCSGKTISFISPILFFLIMNFMFIPYEEKIMTETFGDDFLKYKKRVRRWI